MRIIALLAWYDEPSSWLAATVASVAKCCDYIVALDGAYSLWPEPHTHRKAFSPPEQAEAILEAATGAGLGCLVYRPAVEWTGEAEKRTALFNMGLVVAEPWDDWFLVIDADEIVSEAPRDLRVQLEAVTDVHVGTVALWWTNDLAVDETVEEYGRKGWIEAGGHDFTQRRLLRAIPGLHVRTRHDRWAVPVDYTPVGVMQANGKPTGVTYLRGDPEEVEPAADFTAVRLEHRHARRDLWRKKQKTEYAEARLRTGIENTEAA